MALEDFFTLSEMKDGLANLVRVEELLSIMHNQKDSIRNIVGDAARQWATVANIIAATERKDCLDHFIRLNGLSYLNHWLQEAQKQSDDNSDSSTEELISATLRALERLPVERMQAKISKKRWKTLSLKWSLSEDSDMNCQPADGEVASCNDGLKSSPQAPGRSSSSRRRRRRVCSRQIQLLDFSPQDGFMGNSSDGKATGNEPGLKAEKSVESKISSASSKRSVNAKAVVSELKQGRSEIGLDYGEIDALEVARQVAIEVEREVVDYREPFCSSSPEVTSGGENMDSSSIDLAENTTRGGLAAKSGMKMASPKSVSSVHESVGNSEKKTCDFDLNEDFCSEEADCPMAPTAAPATNLSTPIPVAAPKGAAALPVTPLHFEGELGWRGSAATSAFRPASPRRTPDGERSLSGPKQKAAFFTIDLNIADGEDNEDSAVNNNLLDGRSSSIPSDKSSMEMSSRADRLKLDLNRSEDEDIIPNQHHQNGNRCTSPASSSSSRQPSLRDFDLNDDPSTFDACGSSSLGISTSKESAAYRGYNKFEDPAAVTIMGSRMAVERRDLAAQQTQRATFSGSSSGLCLDSGAATRGASAPYPPMPPHGFSYHGLQMGPAMSILPPFYGPGSIPYMVDSSGTAVVPQILSSPGLGATGGSSGGSGGRPPFFMSVVGPPSGLNMVGGGGPRPGLDLNSGAAHGGEGGGGREIIGNFKHMQGSSGFMEDRVASASQLPAGSGMVLKRKEPECGWDPPYTFGCKQATSWQ
ncbi:unnamed protein product [Spirodela intermedia]|uniref:Uncharacterized protein n=1 Tax=Spirodela intermedia TaxID=51605 RepID=A0A7I8JUT3_SPIIN|nr:unnamed protein product [Spirodela intermedia]CAA6673505.1 unnamed protein product [Spirodela intermedia]